MTNIPPLRFAEFTDKWEQKDFVEIVDVRNGQDYKHLSEGNIPVYGTGGYMTSVSEALSYEEDAIGIGRKGTIDKPQLLRAPFWTVDTLFYAVPKSRYDLDFVFDLFQNVDWKKKDESTGVPSLSKTAINAVNVCVPQLKEQSRIGKLFSEIDCMITTQQRKYEKLIALKSACLEKMFPQNGSKVPEMRCSGFAKDWEQHELGEFGSVSMCKRIFKEQTATEGDVPFYKIGTFGGVPDAFISRDLFDEFKTKYPYPKVGDILLSASGSIGRTVEYTGKDEYFQDSNIVWLSHDERIDNGFLKYFYQVVKWSGLEGSTIKRLYNENILRTQITLPSTDEQKQIGLFMASLDNLITLYHFKQEKLKQLKQAMLNNMFV